MAYLGCISGSRISFESLRRRTDEPTRQETKNAEPDADLNALTVVELMARGKKAYSQGFFDKVAEYMCRRMALAPEDHDVVADYGHALELVGRRDEAIAMFRKSLELKPCADMWLRLVRTLELAGQHANVVIETTKILADPKMTPIPFNKGDVLVTRGEAYAATNQLDKAAADFMVALTCSNARKCISIAREFFVKHPIASGESRLDTESKASAEAAACKAQFLKHVDTAIDNIAESDGNCTWRLEPSLATLRTVTAIARETSPESFVRLLDQAKSQESARESAQDAQARRVRGQ